MIQSTISWLYFSASSDNMARLWSVETGDVKKEYSGHQKAVVCLAFRDEFVQWWPITGNWTLIYICTACPTRFGCPSIFRLDRHRYCRCTASLLLNACWMNFVERMLCVVFCYILLIKMIEYMYFTRCFV